MEEVLRNWGCRNCGRSNRTVIGQDGTAKCEHCGDMKRIQPSRARGQETADQLSLTWRRKLIAPNAPSTRSGG